MELIRSSLASKLPGDWPWFKVAMRLDASRGLSLPQHDLHMQIRSAVAAVGPFSPYGFRNSGLRDVFLDGKKQGPGDDLGCGMLDCELVQVLSSG